MLPSSVDEYARRIAPQFPAGVRDRSAPDRTIYARCSVAAGQTLTSSPTVTILNYSTVNRDTHGIITTGASWVATMPASGVLRFDAYMLSAATTALAVGEMVGLYMLYGVTAYWLDRQYIHPATSHAVHVKGGGSIDVYTGDTIRFGFWNGSGTDMAIGGDATTNWVSLALARVL